MDTVIKDNTKLGLQRVLKGLSHSEKMMLQEKLLSIGPIQEDNTPKPIRAIHKPGRNDKCPCLSGKKYKKCCLIGSKKNQEDGCVIKTNPIQWFTCPNCGSHSFGTVSNVYIEDPRFDRTHLLGECHGYKDTGLACNHVWDRKDDALYFTDKPEDLIT